MPGFIIRCYDKTKRTPRWVSFLFAKDYLNGAELGEKLPKNNVPVLLVKLEFIDVLKHLS